MWPFLSPPLLAGDSAARDFRARPCMASRLVARISTASASTPAAILTCGFILDALLIHAHHRRDNGNPRLFRRTSLKVGDELWTSVVTC